MVTIDIFSIPHLDEKLEVDINDEQIFLAAHDISYIYIPNIQSKMLSNTFSNCLIVGNNDRSEGITSLGRHTFVNFKSI